MKYFIDTEFHEYKKKVLPWLKGINTIDLISIGIVTEELNEPAIGGGILKERSYYAICKDFDLRAAWKNKWLRNNVLESIFEELNTIHYKTAMGLRKMVFLKFSYWSLFLLLYWYGKTKVEIAEEVLEFIHPLQENKIGDLVRNYDENIKFYAYYADYDWVVFCWLFGRMIDLPDGFPMYCRDLKQISDEVYEEQKKSYYDNSEKEANESAIFLNTLSDHLNYPKQSNEHNALDDAKWNKKLFKFIETL